MNWPVAKLDPIQRLHVMAKSLPGCAVEERVFDSTFDELWGLVSDFENGVPQFERGIRSIEIVKHEGERYELDVRSALPLPISIAMDAVVRPGWCWMQSRPRLYLVGMAARQEGDGVRLAHLEGSPNRLGSALRPVIRRMLRHDLDEIDRVIHARR
jgi:hypothetical protein